MKTLAAKVGNVRFTTLFVKQKIKQSLSNMPLPFEVESRSLSLSGEAFLDYF